ncbi:uncharacterized mitochondrial protein AtMg00810-like [Salvia miltiorrhiza]|uniref:uncharacterized mitochondrial protein AtMg00810-like n=1 Tax=Salvia miltiorrhiza TaxID=226208 RepID=UPI0025ACF4F8|nr:uncharacterized mitochondrial protein AtMg00810-like [Salvia miltiorrhiza]
MNHIPRIHIPRNHIPRQYYFPAKQTGPKRFVSDHSLFYKHSNGALLLILIYVDDILITEHSSSEVLSLIDLLHNKFALTSLGSVHYFLGIEVTKSGPSYALCQSKYLKKLLEKTNMSSCHPCSTPMTPATRLSKKGDANYASCIDDRRNTWFLEAAQNTNTGL